MNWIKWIWQVKPWSCQSYWAVILLVLNIAGCLPKAGNDLVEDLEPHRIMPLDTPGYLEPSGLTIYQGRLYTIADKITDTVYEVIFSEEGAKMKPAFRFDPPDSGVMDFEGISVDSDGHFYLASEQRQRILKVTPKGDAEWCIPDLKEHTEEVGFFAKRNAGLEGICWIGPGNWILAAEREPRGLMEVRQAENHFSVSAHKLEDDSFADRLPFWRVPDFSGLYSHEGQVYVLYRNAHLIVPVQKTEDGLKLGETGWSYARWEQDKDWAYEKTVFGQAEGLAVDDKYIYLILDNNLNPRKSDPEDRRPLFMIFHKPKSAQ